MVLVNVHEAKSQLSKLIEAALRGEEVVIARAGVPVVDLVAHPPVHITFGADGWRGKKLDDSALVGPDADIQELFYGADA